jgi:hypothetical protein
VLTRVRLKKQCELIGLLHRTSSSPHVTPVARTLAVFFQSRQQHSMSNVIRYLIRSRNKTPAPFAVEYFGTWREISELSSDTAIGLWEEDHFVVAALRQRV